jgi:HD-GYP domain-containing protein (c-di-GMP phosphodiesterase class II)
MNPVIKFPVYNLKKQILAPAGTVLTEEFMLDLCRRNPHQHDPLPLLGHGKVRSDLLRQFQIPPYDIIFSEREIINRVVQRMEQIHLPTPLLDGLDYFRDNDFHTYRHMLIISALSILISQYLKQDIMDQSWNDLVECGPTHDFGKISVPLSVLLKKKALTTVELEQMQHHALAGYVLLSYYLKDHRCAAAVIARDHHERRDGSG